MNCSFCGKSNDKVKKLVAGPKGVHICDKCVAICVEKCLCTDSEPKKEKLTCQFCDNSPDKAKKVYIVKANDCQICICNKCLSVCVYALIDQL